LAPYARVLNLTGSDQGTLAPYALIPTPLRRHFEVGPTGDREYEIGLSNARAERRMLVQDICAMLVPPQVAREASTATLLRHAVRSVRAEETSTLDDIVRCLAAMGDDAATELAHLLLDTAEMPLAMLFFGSPPPGLLGADAALTVITMAGLRLPDLKIEREYWSAEEALALPMLHTAHRLAVRRCYGGSMHTRKLVGLDEGHFMEGWRSGRSFLVRLARDSRKWNLAALVASQNPRDILGLDVQNLVSTVFVGRIASDPEVAAEALRMLRVPTDVGYEETLASLSGVPDRRDVGLILRGAIPHASTDKDRELASANRPLDDATGDTSRSALHSSRADSKRSATFFARQRWTADPSASGRLARSSRSGRGASHRIAEASAAEEFPRNGRWPLDIS